MAPNAEVVTVSKPSSFVPQPAPFTLEDLKKAIPAHCFQRSALHSLAYLAADLAIISVLFQIAVWISSLPSAVAFVLWPLYWVAQGCVMTGLWVLAHECGHEAFSDYKWLNDGVGLLAHSFLLVPYHSWRISHSHHHSSTGSMENDEVFLPPTESEVPKEPPSTFGIITHMLIMEVFGWPAYLIANVTGPKKYRGKNNSHFSPDSVLFKEKDRADIQISVVFFGIMVACIIGFIFNHGIKFWAQIYLVPLLIVNGWLVTITYLQHTDTYLPHYRGREWNWLRGALATVDRNYGFLNIVFHHIGDTHVAHHLFSKMPHYHAQEATEAIKGVLGKYYQYDDKPIFKALWDSLNKCQYVDDEEGIVFFKRQSATKKKN
eukprot:comp15016_c0_seq1/m.22283 comp15016_c0_seq1/g.22283  ORF comp15016_c0_seq1/g.22283 comp15016_c0_seq1/m.22283 type:complete len:375 (-) comp15016_c0_seq1:72-1196(-)